MAEQVRHLAAISNWAGSAADVAAVDGVYVTSSGTTTGTGSLALNAPFTVPVGATGLTVGFRMRYRLAASGSAIIRPGLSGTQQIPTPGATTSTEWVDFVYDSALDMAGNPWTVESVNTISTGYFRQYSNAGAVPIHVDYYAVVATYTPAGGETKTATAALTVTVGPEAAAAKHAAALAGLDLDIGTDDPAAKHGLTAADLATLIDLAATAAKHPAVVTHLDVLLGVHATETKTAAATAGLTVDLVLTGTTDNPPEHHAATTHLAVGLLIDALTAKTVTAETLLTVTVAAASGTSKHVAVGVPMQLVLDAISTTAKTIGVTAAVDLAVAIAAARTQQARDITIHTGAARRIHITAGGSAAHRTIQPGRTL